jgi:hypothetical protein
MTSRHSLEHVSGFILVHNETKTAQKTGIATFCVVFGSRVLIVTINRSEPLDFDRPWLAIWLKRVWHRALVIC